MSIFPKHINRFNTISIKFQQGVLREIKKMTLKHMWKCKESTIAKVILEMKAWKLNIWDFPGGPVVKNSPANSGDTGLIPGPGRFHMPWSSWACAPQLLSPQSRACKLQLLKLVCLKSVLHLKRSYHSEKLVHCNYTIAPTLCNQGKPMCISEDSVQPKINKINV